MATNHSFLALLKRVLDLTEEVSQVKIEQIFIILEKKELPALVVLFSLPFTFPLQIPGFSTPFGLLLALLGWRIAFSKPLWCPLFIRKKSFSSQNVAKLIKQTIKVVTYLQRFLKPRLCFMVDNPVFRSVNGFLIVILALILSLPLPIPLSNMLTAFPLVSLGLGLLKEDGIFVLIGYFLSLVCFAGFAALFLFGEALLSR